MTKCKYCQADDHDTAEACPRVAVISYCYDGRISRLEFREPPVSIQIDSAAPAAVVGALSEAG